MREKDGKEGSEETIVMESFHKKNMLKSFPSTRRSSQRRLHFNTCNSVGVYRSLPALPPFKPL